MRTQMLLVIHSSSSRGIRFILNRQRHSATRCRRGVSRLNAMGTAMVSHAPLIHQSIRSMKWMAPPQMERAALASVLSQSRKARMRILSFSKAEWRTPTALLEDISLLPLSQHLHMPSQAHRYRHLQAAHTCQLQA